MNALRFFLGIALVGLTASRPQNSSPQASPQASPVPPASCHMTRPARPFIPPADYRLFFPPEVLKHEFLIGTNELWTSIGEPMIWEWRPHSPGHEQDLTAKIFWFRVGYSWSLEPRPKLKVTGRRIDGPAPPLALPQGSATNVIMDEHHGAMLTGVYIPVPGCWEITGDYEGDKLSFVVWVVPQKSRNQ
jgi:hypothetical protein